MKKILYIGQYNGIIGGIERYMQKSAELLRKNGFELHYRYIENGGREQEHFALAFDTIKRFTPGDEILQSADMVILHNIIDVKYLEFLPEKRSFFFAHDHNIYCQRHHYYMPIGRINCHRKRNPFFCQLCSLGRNPAPPLEEYRRFPALVLSDFMAENLRKNGFEKVFKLPPFIRAVEKEHTFLPDGVLRILFLGQLIRGKGADLLLQALSHFTIPFHCTIAGDGKDRAMLEQMVDEFQLRSKVSFTGFVSDPEKLWENCDLFCFPIRWQEPFGLVGLEAMAHGIPVVAFDLGGVREWLNDGENGLLVPEKRIVRFSAMMEICGVTPSLLERLGKEALKSVKEKFPEENFVNNFNTLMESVK